MSSIFLSTVFLLARDAARQEDAWSKCWGENAHRGVCSQPTGPYVRCLSTPAAFEGLSPGAGPGRHEGCVNPISSPRNVFLSKFNSPASSIPPKPTCSLVAGLWLWLLLHFLAAWGWWFAALSLSSAGAASFKVPGKPVLPLAGFIFKSGCTALRTGGSLVLPSLSVYSAAGFRKSPLVPV